MTDDEANAVFDDLMAALRASGLNWIADQVSDEITDGRSIIAELPPEQSRKTRAKFTRIVPYDAKYKLLKLITSIEATVVSSVWIVNNLANFISTSMPTQQPLSIVFSNDVVTASTYQISKDTLAATMSAGEGLQHLLTELKDEVNGAHQSRTPS